MKRNSLLCLATGLFLASIITPVYAEDTNEPVIKQRNESGYTITAAGGNGDKSLDPEYSQNTRKKRSLQSYTMKRGQYRDFNDETLKRYGNAELKTESGIDLDYTDTSASVDYLVLNGYTKAFWYGDKPQSNADRITVLPSQSITASGTVFGVSIPPSVSWNAGKESGTFTWPSEYDTDAYRLTYNWDKITCKAVGTARFTGVTVNDISNFKFGSTITSVTNTIDVTINK